jgi:chromate transporter
VTSRDFFAGYGAVQAMPGPIFTFAAFLGAANASPLNGVAGALVATVAIFVPSFALIFALAPAWDRLRALPAAAAALRGANASVVGLLGSVLYFPILTSLGANANGIAIALAAYALIAVWNFPPWTVVVASALLGAGAGALG